MNNKHKQVEFEEVLKFLIKTRGSGNELSSETRLYHDLGMDGEDAEEFLLDFQKYFHVDLSGLNFDEHFGPEWSLLLLLPWKWKKFSGKRNTAGQVMKIPITLNDLHQAAIKKQWPDLSGRLCE